MAAHCSQWALSTKNSQWTVFIKGWSPWRQNMILVHSEGTEDSSVHHSGFIGTTGATWWGDNRRLQIQTSEFKDPDFNLSQRDTLQSYQSSQQRYFATRENALGAYSVQCMSFLHFLQQIFLLSTRVKLPHTMSLWTTPCKSTSRPLHRRLQTSIVIDTMACD